MRVLTASRTVLLAPLLALSLAACDSGGLTECPDASNPACGGPVDGTVTEYLGGLPSWDAFAPDVPELPPTPTGEAVFPTSAYITTARKPD